ncbi:SAP30-binding protein [Hydra vulgaris]|uniref:SAP30-binding protein n=1 Tax=Hydra vulgaris TaxID=6087 RepID=A0ABM4C6G6_HYDVU
MSLTDLSRYNDNEDEIKDEDHDLILAEKLSPMQPSVETPNTSSDNAAKPRGLVSYIGEYTDDESSDDEGVRVELSLPASAVNFGLFDGGNAVSSIGSTSPSSTVDTLENIEKEQTVRLPPEPEGRCSKSLQEKIAKLIEKKNNGMNVNEYVQRKKEFRNPSIYEKLVSFIGIDEHGTNFPKEIFDPTIWGPESHYDNLAKLQKEYHDKKEKEKLKRTQVEFVKKIPNPTPTDKKTKWDQKIPVKALENK